MIKFKKYKKAWIRCCCKNCIYYDISEGRCCRYPPQIYGDDIEARAEFPGVISNYWCGEYQLDKSIWALGIYNATGRYNNSLESSGIKTIGDLCGKELYELLQISGVGKKTVWTMVRNLWRLWKIHLY